jgi:hypothetical protein
MQIPPKVSGVRKVDPKLVMARPQVRKTPFLYYRPNGRNRCVDSRLELWIDQRGDRLPPPPRRNRDKWSLGLMWLDQDERAVGHQRLPCSLEGMDHALDCDSSKRPAEECNLKWFATQAEPLG